MLKLKNTTVRQQMLIVFIGIIVFIFGALYIINARFLEPYYISNKETAFVELYNELKEASKKDLFDDDDELSELRHMAEKENMSFFVVDQSDGVVASNVRDSELMHRQLFGYLLDQEAKDTKVLEKTDDYQLNQTIERMSGISYIEMWGKMKDEQYFLIRSPMESIRDSVRMSSRFLLFVGLIMGFLSVILVWYFSKRLTKPILQLTDISSRMAELDFNARYEGHGAKEIDKLGENYNLMSKRLEQTISELKSANNKLQKDIEQKERIEQMRYDFLGNVSHELKTPLALIQGYAEGLKEGISDDPESREFYCDVILDETDKMSKMVKNLLTLNQVEFGSDEIIFERFNLTEMISEILVNMDIMLQQEEITLNFRQDEDIYVWADPSQVEHVIRNYLSNAIHHANGDKVIEIKITVNDDKARTSVFNTGNPIPEEDLDHIWDKFYKVDKAHTREYGGNGIGLSIVKAIMSSIKQKYGVKNYDNGVEFWFELDVK